MAPWQLVASRKEQAAAQRRITYAENQANQHYQSKGSGGKGGGGKAKGNGKGARAATEWNLAKGDIYYQALHDFYAMDKGSAKGARGKGAGGDGKGSRPPSPVGSEDIAWVCKVKGCGTVHNNPTCQWCRLCGQPKPIPKGVKDKEAKQIVIKEESFVAPPTTQSARQRGKGYTKERAVATAVEGASAESDALTLTKAEKKKARAELLTQTIIDMANTDPTVYLADKLANCGETKCDMAKSSTLQSDLDKMILSGTFTEDVIDAQRKEIIEAKQRETKAAKHAMTNWKLPQQANQRLLRLQADIEGKHTKAVEEHKKLEDDTTAAIKALREKLDQANVAKDLEDKVYTEKIDKVKCALDLLPAAYGKQKLIEEQMQDDQDMDELELLEESDQEVDQPSQDPISASKVKFILDEALKQANLQATGNAELQQGLAALFGGIGNALIAATSGGSNPKIASKKMIKKTKAAKVPVVPVDSDSDFDSDVDIPAAARKRHRENPESEEDIYPWDDEGETATMRIEQGAA